MIIATAPPGYREKLLKTVFSCPEIGGVRYNTGMVSPHTPEHTLAILKKLAEEYGKKLWVDLKGRQLRIVSWALPDYGNIVINHDVEVEGPAWVYLRDGEKLSPKFARRNILYVDPPPRQAVGQGQSLNIIGEHVKIKGYLTENDKAYIDAAWKLGVGDFMLSFVEGLSDIKDMLREIKSDGFLGLTFHIESPAGIAFLEQTWPKKDSTHRLVLARDDLFTTIGEDKSLIVEYSKKVLAHDPKAILASKLFSDRKSTRLNS